MLPLTNPDQTHWLSVLDLGGIAVGTVSGLMDVKPWLRRKAKATLLSCVHSWLGWHAPGTNVLFVLPYAGARMQVSQKQVK